MRQFMIPACQHIAAAECIAGVTERRCIRRRQQWACQRLAVCAVIRIALQSERVRAIHGTVDAESTTEAVPAVESITAGFVCRRVPLEIFGVSAVIGAGSDFAAVACSAKPLKLVAATCSKQ